MNPITGTGAGGSSAAALGAVLAAGQGAAGGACVILGHTAALGPMRGTAAGGSSAAAVGRTLAAVQGAAGGTSADVAYTTGTVAVRGTAGGASTAAALGAVLAAVTGTAGGTSAAIGYLPAPVFGTGSASGVSDCIGTTAGKYAQQPGTLTDYGKTDLLAVMRGRWRNWEVMLLTSTPPGPPLQEWTLADVTEATFPLYTRKVITDITYPTLDGAGHAVIQGKEVRWTNGGQSAVSLVGWGYVALGGDGELRACGLFDPPVTLPPAADLALVPELDDSSLW